jgi:hypothetical protein
MMHRSLKQPPLIAAAIMRKYCKGSYPWVTCAVLEVPVDAWSRITSSSTFFFLYSSIMARAFVSSTPRILRASASRLLIVSCGNGVETSAVHAGTACVACFARFAVCSLLYLLVFLLALELSLVSLAASLLSLLLLFVPPFLLDVCSEKC